MNEEKHHQEEFDKTIELEVRRVLAENQDSFRSFIEKSLKHFIWVITSLTIIIIGLLFYFLGDKSDKLETKINDGVSQIVFENKIYQKINDTIDFTIDRLMESKNYDLNARLDRLIESKNYDLYARLDSISEKLDNSIYNMVELKTPDIEANVQAIIDQYQGAELEQLFKEKLNQIKKMNQVPSGTIIAWFGKDKLIPLGWVICDGSNNTPDLTNRFIMGAKKSEIGVTGGTENHEHIFNMDVSPLTEDSKYKNSKLHALKTENLIESKKEDLDFKTERSSNIPPYVLTFQKRK